MDTSFEGMFNSKPNPETVKQKVDTQYIKDVFNEVVANFNNIELKSLVKEKSFIAGGCIRSLRNNEDINDYDFFFRSKDSANRFAKLIELGLQNKLDASPLAAAVGNNQGFTKKTMRLKSNKSYEYQDATNSTKILAITHNAITFRIRSNKFKDGYAVIQFITKYCGEPDKVIGCFDFTNSMAHFDPKIGEIFAPWQFEHANKHKILEYNDNAFSPIDSLARIDKFTQKGYHIKWDQLQRLMLQITEKHTIKEIKAYKARGAY